MRVALTLPGSMLVIVCSLAFRHAWRGKAPNDFNTALPLGVGLLGLWMTGTHVLLVGEGFRGLTTPEIVVFHVAPGLATIVLAALAHNSVGRASETVSPTSDLGPPGEPSSLPPTARDKSSRSQRAGLRR